MKNRDDVMTEVLEGMQMLIGMTSSGPTRNKLCEVSIYLMGIENGIDMRPKAEHPQGILGDFKPVNVHQFLDGTGFSYHLLVPQNTQLVCRVTDSRDRTMEVRPVKSMDEFTAYVYPTYKAPKEAAQ